VKITIEFDPHTVARVTEEEEQEFEDYVRTAVALRRITDTPQETLALIDEETPPGIITTDEEGGL
jgi:hypothetical protein